MGFCFFDPTPKNFVWTKNRGGARPSPARVGFFVKSNLVDLARIGLAPRQCECRVIPLYYRPVGRILTQNFVGPPGVGPGPYTPHGHVLPTYSGPFLSDAPRRAAGNRTRSLRTRIACTTGILRPDGVHHPCALCRARTCDLSRVKRTL